MTELKEEMKELKELVKQSLENNKKKKFRMPMKGKVSKGKLKKGYITIVKVEENINVDFIKQPIADGTFKLDDTYHAIDEKDIFIYKGKPLIIQAKNKLNPYNPIQEENETYGQKYIMARMKSDIIKGKKKSVGVGLIIGLIVIAAVAYFFFNGGI